jgi:peptidoglycan/LPS O-acetylase OafA/YrhL
MLLTLAGVWGLTAWIGLRLSENAYPGTDSTVVCLFGVVLLLSQIGVQNAGCHWLAWRPLVMIGQISYGVYLWQQLFLGDPILGFEAIRTFPAGLILTFLVATASYLCLERPLIRLKDKRFHSHLPSTEQSGPSQALQLPQPATSVSGPS